MPFYMVKELLWNLTALWTICLECQKSFPFPSQAGQFRNFYRCDILFSHCPVGSKMPICHQCHGGFAPVFIHGWCRYNQVRRLEIENTGDPHHWNGKVIKMTALVITGNVIRMTALVITGDVIRMTALLITGDVEGKLQHPQRWLGQ